MNSAGCLSGQALPPTSSNTSRAWCRAPMWAIKFSEVRRRWTSWLIWGSRLERSALVTRVRRSSLESSCSPSRKYWRLLLLEKCQRQVNSLIVKNVKLSKWYVFSFGRMLLINSFLVVVYIEKWMTLVFSGTIIGRTEWMILPGHRLRKTPSKKERRMFPSSATTRL